MFLETIEVLQEDVLNVEDVKEYLKVETTEDDAVIENMINAAVEKIEETSLRSIRQKELRLRLDEVKEIFLPRPPVLKVISVKVDGKEVDESKYVFLPPDLFYTFEKLAGSNRGGIEIDYLVGYEYEIPKYLEQLILRICAFWYEHRGDEELPVDIEREILSLRGVRL